MSQINDSDGTSTVLGTGPERMVDEVKEILVFLPALGLFSAITYEVGFFEALGLDPLGINLWMIPVPLAEYARTAIAFTAGLCVLMVSIFPLSWTLSLLLHQFDPLFMHFNLHKKTGQSMQKSLADRIDSVFDKLDISGRILYVTVELLLIACWAIMGILAVFVVWPMLQTLQLFGFEPLGTTASLVSFGTVAAMLCWLAYATFAGQPILGTWIFRTYIASVAFCLCLLTGAFHGTLVVDASDSERIFTKFGSSCLGISEGQLIRSYSNGALFFIDKRQLVWLPTDQKSLCWVSTLMPRKIHKILVTPTIFGYPLSDFRFKSLRNDRLDFSKLSPSTP